MKKLIVLIMLVLLLASVLGANALIIKKMPSIFGKFAGRITGMQVAEPIPPAQPPCLMNFKFINNENIGYTLLNMQISPTSVKIIPQGSPDGTLLHFYESNNQNNKTILAKEFFVLTSKTSPRFTRIMQYVGSSISQRRLFFEDLGTGSYEVEYNNVNEGAIVAGGAYYALYFDPNTQRIAIDQNADGFINGEQAVIVENSGKIYDQAYFTTGPICSAKCTDSDKSPDYGIVGLPAPDVQQNYADLFVRGKAVGENQPNSLPQMVGEDANTCSRRFLDPASAYSTFMDCCADSNTLTESFCKGNTGPLSIQINCKTGCKDGVCIKAPELPAVCKDSDGGKVYGVQGITTAYDGSRAADYCHNPGITIACSGPDCYLSEHYCTEGQMVGEENIVCPNGCKDGACLATPPAQVCTDSDNSPDYGIVGLPAPDVQQNYADLFVRGKAVGENQPNSLPQMVGEDANTCSRRFLDPASAYSTFMDCCADSNTLTESFCKGNTGPLSIQINCKTGCKDGVCIKAPAVLSCTGLEMVWTIGRREPYTYAADACASYRCLNGNEISAVCYNAADCPAACTGGTCVSITEMKKKCPASKCTDSDGGQNIFVAGNANTPLVGTIDNCDFTQNVRGILREAVCAKDGTPTHVSVTCPARTPYCRDAICTSDGSAVCTDTDGDNINTKGTIKERRYSPAVEATDYCEDLTTLQLSNPCSGANCGVREFTCQTPYQTTTYQDVPCPLGCKDGACVSAPACTDSDKGMDYYTKGTATNSDGTSDTDYCSSANGLNEAFCCSSENEFSCTPVGHSNVASAYACPVGCQDGACLMPVVPQPPVVPIVPQPPVVQPPIVPQPPVVLPPVVPRPIAERVTCMFKGTTQAQKCYSDKGECSGRLRCSVAIAGTAGEKVLWKSTCGGYYNTTIDGRNEVAVFACVRQR